ncbi:MAG: spore coat protein [Clostridia bacterium]
MINVSVKEFHAIETQLEAEKILINKYRDFAKSATENNLRDKCLNIASVHEKHYNTLLGYLK